MAYKHRFLWLIFLISISGKLFSQTLVNLANQNNYTYTETFSDIANWKFDTSHTGNFSAGTGAAAWKGINTTGGTNNVPDPLKITIVDTNFTTGTAGGLQKGSGNLLMLTTGSTDNTSAMALDFFVNFSGLKSGTLSFDWSSVTNASGDRKSTLKVYGSTDGTNYTELTGAQVLNITNGTVTSGSITNVNLPSSFTCAPIARIRFYLFNGTGGTTGSRPKISLDNVKVTGTPVTAPVSQPTNINFSSILSNAATANFTAANSNPDHYILLLSNNPSLSSFPVNGVNYNIGDNIDDASVIAVSTSLSYTISTLSPSTLYYVYVFSLNDSCGSYPLYNITAPLTGSFTTASGLSNCSAPGAQPTALSFSNVTFNSIQGNFNPAANTDEYLVVRTTAQGFSTSPTNGTVYNIGDALGTGKIVSKGPTTSFLSDSLNASTTYYYYVFGLNSQNCSNGPVYLTTNPLTGNTTTASEASACTTPANQPGNLVFTGDNNSIAGNFTASTDADSYLVLYSTSASLSQNPSNNTSYAVGATLGNATVASNSANTYFTVSNLTASTQYYFFIYAQNSYCTGGPKYKTTAPLTQSITTSASGTYNYYFGNLHAHSHYSDGNKDSTNFTPADDYSYAKNSLGMDFLGISEHNHSGAGMNISNWPLGLAQANAATNSNFVALYGQEWGVISGGGHVIVYGTDSLLGWETANYNSFVPKSDYIGTPSTTGTTGLFRKLNKLGNCIASYAHPNSTDFDNIANLSYNATADSAIIGSAIESGPAFSTNTSYSDYPTSVAYLSYYMKMLSKGYHLGPFMDHDTHYTNFGRANENRLVILAPSLTKANLMSALKARRFYATEDIDTRVSITVNSQVMGSITSGNTAPVIVITANDPTSPANATKSIKLMYGIPGSGVNATQLAAGTTGTLNYTHTALVTGTTAYYYADITINGKRTITSPIWYTKTSTPPPTPIITLNAATGLTEANLNGSTFTVTLTNDVFANFSNNPTILNPTHFTLSNAPAGTSISSVQATSNTTASVTLSYNHTDFDTNISSLSLAIAASELGSGSIHSSNNTLTITAFNETISTGTVTAFSDQIINTVSAAKSFTVSATQLTDNLVITAPTGFEISTNATTGYGNSLSLTPASGTINSTTIYVHFIPANAIAYSGNITASSQNATTQNIAVTGTGLAANITLQLKVLFQGFYAANGNMQPVLLNQGISGNNTLTDSATVELHNATAPYAKVTSTKAIINTNGTGNFSFTGFTGNYYLVVKQRNSLETWSAAPVSFNNTTISYDFTTAANKAYGNNLIQVDGYWTIYCGDLNQDGLIDTTDYAAFENDNQHSVSLIYNSSDLNGDGYVDSFDFSMLENNKQLGAAVIAPIQ